MPFISRTLHSLRYSLAHLFAGAVVLGIWDMRGLSTVIPRLRVRGRLLARRLRAGPSAIRVADDLLQTHDLVPVVASVNCAVVEVPRNSRIRLVRSHPRLPQLIDLEVNKRVIRGLRFSG